MKSKKGVKEAEGVCSCSRFKRAFADAKEELPSTPVDDSSSPVIFSVSSCIPLLLPIDFLLLEIR